jgi:hypothetical protein
MLYRSANSGGGEPGITPGKLPHGRNVNFREDPTASHGPWAASILEGMKYTELPFAGMWHGVLAEPYRSFATTRYPATLADFTDPVVAQPYISHARQDTRVSYNGYRSGGMHGTEQETKGGSEQLRTKAASFLCRTSLGSGLQYGYKDLFQDAPKGGRLKVQDGVGYVTYLVEEGADSTVVYSALGIPNRNLEDRTRGRPGVSSMFWVPGLVSPHELTGLAARDFPAEVAQARMDAPDGEIGICGLSLVLLP